MLSRRWHYVVKAIFESCPDNFLAYTGLRIYRKHLTISPGIIFFRKRFLIRLYRVGAYIREGGGAYTWMIFCVTVIVINKYSNNDKQVLSIVIIVINSDSSDK